MSRMDRYKNIHKKAKPLKENSGSIFARRERKQKNTQNDPYYQEEYWEEEQTSQQNNTNRERSRTPYQDYQEQPGGFGKKFQSNKGPKPPKKRKKRSWKKILLTILILLVVYSIGAFFAGKFMAEHDTSLPSAGTEAFNGAVSSDGAHNILILGSDTRGEDSGRADTIMVLQLDGLSHKPKLISFMRDSFVTIPGVGQNKINSAYAYGGADLVRQTLLENFGINCQYYAKVDFKSFEKVVDALFMNGVKIDAEKDLNLDGVDIKKGVQRMDGHVLLQYARFRMDEEGDFGRVRRQQQVMHAVFSQLKNPLNLIRAPYAAGKALGYTSTSITSTFILKNLFSIARGAGGIDSLSVPVEGSWSYGQSDYAGSILVIDNQMNQAAINDFLSK